MNKTEYLEKLLHGKDCDKKIKRNIEKVVLSMCEGLEDIQDCDFVKTNNGNFKVIKRKKNIEINRYLNDYEVLVFDKDTYGNLEHIFTQNSKIYLNCLANAIETVYGKEKKDEYIENARVYFLNKLSIAVKKMNEVDREMKSFYLEKENNKKGTSIKGQICETLDEIKDKDLGK